MSERPLHVPTWWEKRFPWVEELLIRLDPAPLGASLNALLRPLWRPVELLCELMDRGLAAVASVARTAWAGVGDALASLVRSLPLPAFLRCWLWVGPARLRDADDCAQLLLRRQSLVVRPTALVSAVLVHVAIFTVGPEVRVEAAEVVSEELVAIEIPHEVEIPPPPAEIQRPAAPVVATADLREDITIAPTTWETLTREEALAPPPLPVEEKSDANEPTFTPFTVAPVIQNAAEIARRMGENYPAQLREAGIGGVVLLWAFVDERGRVSDVRVAESSGHESLDAAALEVASGIRFSPAINRDVEVAVWIQMPLEFEVR